MKEVVIELCGGQMPQKQTAGAAAYDLYVKEDIVIKGHWRNRVPLGFKMQIPVGYAAEILPRSGYSLKAMEGYPTFCNNDERMPVEDNLLGIRFTGDKPIRFNADVLHGLVDSDYRGEVGVMLKNNDVDFVLKKGQRIAQMIIRKVESPAFVEGNVNETDRGEGGFGSTGV